MWAMSALGPKQTRTTAPHRSAFGGKADREKLYIAFGKSGHRAPREVHRAAAEVIAMIAPSNPKLRNLY